MNDMHTWVAILISVMAIIVANNAMSPAEFKNEHAKWKEIIL